MKAYKVFIPELSEYVDADFVEKYCKISRDETIGYDIFHFTRAEIHELVQKHAFELGWRWAYGHKDVKQITPYLLFNWSGKIEIFENSHDFNKSAGPEISWQDFLKLTPADVSEPPQGTEVPDLPEYEKIKNETPIRKYFRFTGGNRLFQSEYEQDMRSCEREQCIKNTYELQKNDRNEKAWDILKVIVARDYDASRDSLLDVEINKPEHIENNVSDAFRYADEFIRQSNAGDKTEPESN